MRDASLCVLLQRAFGGAHPQVYRIVEMFSIIAGKSRSIGRYLAIRRLLPISMCSLLIEDYGVGNAALRDLISSTPLAPESAANTPNPVR